MSALLRGVTSWQQNSGLWPSLYLVGLWETFKTPNHCKFSLHWNYIGGNLLGNTIKRNRKQERFPFLFCKKPLDSEVGLSAQRWLWNLLWESGQTVSPGYCPSCLWDTKTPSWEGSPANPPKPGTGYTLAPRSLAPRLKSCSGGSTALCWSLATPALTHIHKTKK